MDVHSFHDLHGLNPKNPSAAWDAISQHVAPGTRRDLIYQCIADLVARGLLEYHGGPSALQGAVLPWPGDLAWDFYIFISADDDPHEAADDTESPN